MHLRIKICGITCADTARAATDAGADALGFMFYRESRRFVARAQAAEIIRMLPPFVARVGVFVNPLAEEVRQAIIECGLDTLQFHGDEPPEFCRQFGMKAIKAFRLHSAESLQALPAYDREAWLLDSHVPGQLGGSGATFNWDWAAAAVKMGRPVLLAGGLTPDNVALAVRQVRPFALDVSSGVESAPGRKDPLKVAAFIRAARRAAAECD